MDKKVKKYVDYVVNDLVKKTEIDIDNELIYFPYTTLPFAPKIDIGRVPISSRSLLFFLPNFPRFVSYVEKTYGVGMIEEINIIWDQYRVKLIKQINYLIE